MTIATERPTRYARMKAALSVAACSDWDDIAAVLDQLRDSVPLHASPSRGEFLEIVGTGVAFVTFDYGIDGVSIEISKYGQALESYLKSSGDAAMHLIGGDFYPQADAVAKQHWHRKKIEGINGWSKWDGGKWFSALFYEEMPEGSPESDTLAEEIFTQGVSIADRLGRYLAENNISLLIPVNIACNPGNIALTLALVMVTEAMGIYVINSNHDFYWEGGEQASEKEPGELAGIRDHFYYNVDNQSFFRLFESLYPWNGQRWLQVNINKRQSRRLIREFSFSKNKVFELSTSVSDWFFKDYSQQDVKFARLRMAHILSDGKPIINPIPVDAHRAGLADWMEDQTPRVLGARSGLTLDLTSDDLIYLLQPTRVVARKRVERNFVLIKQLLARPYFRAAFENNQPRQIVLHITGPTPIEHEEDHEKILRAYANVIASVPTQVSDRIFLAFSVGRATHPSFSSNNFRRLYMEDIYRMATVVVFPSEQEGRGLPIIEAGACGVPIICSRYEPDEVFAEVVGEDLPAESQIDYVLFPKGAFPESFLQEVSQLLLHPELNEDRVQHNRNAVRSRFSSVELKRAFGNLLDTLRTLH